MDYSRQKLVDLLRRAGMPDLADEAQETLPDPVDDTLMAKFCAAHGLSQESLIDRMGGSP
jgi:hypothetical protein